MKRLKIILLQNKILILFFLIIIIYSFIYIRVFNPRSISNTHLEGYITSIKYKDDKLTLIIKSNKKTVVNYYLKSDINLEYGDYISLDGEYTSINENTNSNLFNYKRYLYSNRVYYMFNAKSIKVIKKNKNILFNIKNIIVKRIEKCTYSKKYLYIFLLSNKSYLEDNIYDSYKDLGLVHLICISGMHISCIILLLNKLFNKKIINYIFLIVYLFLLEFSISILRCFLFYLFKNIKDKYNLKISNIKLLLIIMMILILSNPFIIYNIAFQFSFIISLGLNISKEYINNSITKTSLIAFLYSIPILINNYFKVNFITVLVNIFFISLISYIIFPFTCLVFLFNFLDRYLCYLTSFVDKIVLKISKIKIFTFSFSKQNIILIIIYYLLLILFIRNRKYFIGIITLIVVFYFNNYYLINPRVYFIDVGQGDSSLIRINNKNYLIDTGGNYNYDLGSNILIPFLNSVGVKKIDYLITTHGDFDHIGESKSLISNYKVDKVIFNCGPLNELEKELIDMNISYEICINKLDNLYFLQTKEYDNENDNSNVIYTNINGYKFLFMGDASYITEKEILKKYNISNIDVLKVGHHGSKTSSSKEFIDIIRPKYSIISVGKNNRYGHPNKEVLNILDNSKIYRTDQDGSIIFIIRNKYIDVFD